MATTIQISEELLSRLKKFKFNEKESYEEIIWDMIEDKMELSEEAKRNIAEAEEDIMAGRVHKWADVIKELKINVRNNSFG
jgi:predicted transcriptional regulator